jgi:hypothetical protein
MEASESERKIDKGETPMIIQSTEEDADSMKTGAEPATD